MRKKPNTTDKQAETDDQVKLKPIMGIRPGVYLTILYSAILLVILFLLLIFPGLNNPGAMLLVKTEPEMAAVRVNGVYMGVSGSFFYIPRGIQTIEAVLPGFETESTTLEIPARVFGSLFFPARKKIEMTLKTNNPAGVFAEAASEFAAWTFGGEPTSSWQVPLVLSETAYRVGQYASPETNEILKAASRFAVTRSAVRDLTRAKVLLDNAGSSPSPAGLLDPISDILVFLSENPESAAWLSGLLPPESASIVRASVWNNGENTVLYPETDIPLMTRIELSGLEFRPILKTNGKGFFISETAVPNSLFQTFLSENPEWKDGYTDYFNDEIAVLSHENGVITGVSWYAADAFCRWLTKRLPSSMSEMEVRLPTEAEWAAAQTYIKSMEASGWEWCADPFAPLQFITASSGAVEAVGSPERVLRGSSSASAEQTRASLPPDLSSPFVTFRPVISQRAADR